MKTRLVLPLIVFVGLKVSPTPLALAGAIQAASTDRTDVLNAIQQAVSVGDRVVIPAGTSTWTAAITITNAIFIQGNGTNEATGRTMIINGQSSANPAVGDNPLFTVALDVQARLDISGIYFRDASGKDSTAILIPGSGIFERIVVIHNNMFEGFYFSVMNNGAWGLQYSNHHLNNDWNIRVRGFNTVAVLPVPNPESYKWSSTNYWVMEDELYQQVGLTRDRYFVDTEYPANYIVRHCRFECNRARNVVLDAFDMHGENQNAERVPLGPVIYNNTFHYTGNNQVNDPRICDIRGGANTLIYSNTVLGAGIDTAKVHWRDDPSTPNFLVTNSYAWQNSSPSGPWSYFFLNGVTKGRHVLLSKPGDFRQLPYPHPLRTH